MIRKLKRWTSGIVASFDSMIGTVENHEELVNSAMREVSEASARARAQLHKVQKDGLAMRRRLNDMRQQEGLWKERTRRSAEEDEKLALECMRRVRQYQTKISRLEEDERTHSALEKQLKQDLEKISERLQQLKEQRNLFRTRQSRAEALKTVQGNDAHLIADIEETFERWENKITKYEFQGGCDSQPVDDLADTFDAEEEQSQLKASLQELLQQTDEIGRAHV